MIRYSHNTNTWYGTPIITSTSNDKPVIVCMTICARETWQTQTSYLSSKKRMWPVSKNVAHNTGRWDEENLRVKSKSLIGPSQISWKTWSLQMAFGYRPWLLSQGKKAKKVLRLLQYWPVLQTSGYLNTEWRVGEMCGVFIWRGGSDLCRVPFKCVHTYSCSEPGRRELK